MSKKILNKIVSAVLVLAICSTAFLGCVVSAAEGVAKVEGAAYALAGDTAIATVTLTSADPFIAGLFTVTADAGLTFDNATVTKWANSTTGDTIEYPDVNVNADNGKVIFQGFRDTDLATYWQYDSVTIEVSFKATGLVAGTKYNVKVSGIQLTDINEAEYTVADATGYVHVHKYGEGVAEGNVTTYTCETCQGTKKETTTDTNVGDLTTTELFEVENFSITFMPNGDLTLNYLTKSEDVKYLALIENDVIVKLIECGGTIKEFDAYQIPYEGGVKTIGDVVCAAFVDANIENISAVTEYSIAQYCGAVIGDADAKQTEKDYCQAMLNYAAAAQAYFNYNADALVNAGYEADYSATELADGYAQTGDNSVWKLRAAEVSMATKPIVRLYFVIGEGKNIADIDFVISYENGDKTVTVPGENLTAVEVKGETRYYYDIKDLRAKSMRSTINVTAKEKEVLVDDQSATYSVESYAARAQQKTDEALKNVTKLLVAYSDALAEAYPN